MWLNSTTAAARSTMIAEKWMVPERPISSAHHPVAQGLEGTRDIEDGLVVDRAQGDQLPGSIAEVLPVGVERVEQELVRPARVGPHGEDLGLGRGGDGRRGGRDIGQGGQLTVARVDDLVIAHGHEELVELARARPPLAGPALGIGRPGGDGDVGCGDIPQSSGSLASSSPLACSNTVARSTRSAGKPVVSRLSRLGLGRRMSAP